jgi:hypothetical protein
MIDFEYKVENKDFYLCSPEELAYLTDMNENGWELINVINLPYSQSSWVRVYYWKQSKID